jgi:hypothetical protein
LNLSGCCECGLCKRGATSEVTRSREEDLPEAIRAPNANANNDDDAAGLGPLDPEGASMKDGVESKLQGQGQVPQLHAVAGSACVSGGDWVRLASKQAAATSSSRGESLLVSLLDVSQAAVISLYFTESENAALGRAEWLDALHWSLHYQHFQRFRPHLLPAAAFSKARHEGLKVTTATF